MGVSGVTENTSRESELGTGKWDAQGRDMQSLVAAMPSTEVRDIEIIEQGRGWAIVAVALVLSVLGGLVWMAISPLQEEESTLVKVKKEIPTGSTHSRTGRSSSCPPIADSSMMFQPSQSQYLKRMRGIKRAQMAPIN